MRQLSLPLFDFLTTDQRWVLEDDELYTLLLLQCGRPPRRPRFVNSLAQEWYMEARDALEPHIHPACKLDKTMLIDAQISAFLSWLDRGTVHMVV